MDGHELLLLAILLINVASFAGSSFMICSIFKCSQLNKKVSTKFSASILISSAVICLNLVICVILIKLEEFQNFIGFCFFCSLLTFDIVRCYSSCALSITSLIAMMWPVKYKAFETHRRRTNIGIIMVWIWSVLGSMPVYFAIWGQFEAVFDKAGTGIYWLLMSVLPVSITWLSCSIMYVKMYRTRKASAIQTSDEHRPIISQWQSGVTQALLANIPVTLASSFTFKVCIMINVVNDNKVELLIPSILFAIQHPLFTAIFYILAKDYREAAKKHCLSLFCKPLSECVRGNQRQEGSVQYRNPEAESDIRAVQIIRN